MAEEVKEDVLEIEKETVDNPETVEDAPKTFTQSEVNKWLNRNGKWYWLDHRGASATGWKKIEGSWYYFNSDGDMQTGWVKYKDDWFYLNANNGFMESNQFVKGQNGWYYLNDDGVMEEKPDFTVEPTGLITVKPK